MSKILNIKGAADRKFIASKPVKDTTRKNIILDAKLHSIICLVLIEIGESLKMFVTTALETYLTAEIETYPTMATNSGTVNTTIFLPREKFKQVKRTAKQQKKNENDVILTCIILRLRSLQKTYPKIIAEKILEDYNKV